MACSWYVPSSKDKGARKEELYHFMHAYVNDHMSPAEFDAFFVGEVAEYYQY